MISTSKTPLFTPAKTLSSCWGPSWLSSSWMKHAHTAGEEESPWKWASYSYLRQLVMGISAQINRQYATKGGSPEEGQRASHSVTFSWWIPLCSGSALSLTGSATFSSVSWSSSHSWTLTPVTQAPGSPQYGKTEGHIVRQTHHTRLGGVRPESLNF